MKNEYILVFDQGTTSSKVFLFDRQARVVAHHGTEFTQYTFVDSSRSGWVEHDLDEIWASTLTSLDRVLTDVRAQGLDFEIRAIGITNQRETLGFWSKTTGKPLTRALVWQDRRTSDWCYEQKQKGLEPLVQKKSGLLLDPYFSASKIRWVLDHIPAVSQACGAGDLKCGTIDTWLLDRLTQGKSFFTDVTNASRTALMDLEAPTQWSPELCAVFGVDQAVLATIRPTAGPFGETQNVPGIADAVPVLAMIGDQQSALLGQNAVQAGQGKCTYGTGAFLLVNTGRTIQKSQHRLLTTVAWDLGSGCRYALEGSSFMAGAVVQWFRDGLGLIQNASDIEALAKKVPNAGGLSFIPAFVGLGAPHWDPDVRAALFGIERGTTLGHLAHAALDGIVWSIDDVIQAMIADGAHFKQLWVDGGAVANALLVQKQADVSGVGVVRSPETHATARGAALAAGVGLGWWSETQLPESPVVEPEFLPQTTPAQRASGRDHWAKRIRQLRS